MLLARARGSLPRAQAPAGWSCGPGPSIRGGGGSDEGDPHRGARRAVAGAAVGGGADPATGGRVIYIFSAAAQNILYE